MLKSFAFMFVLTLSAAAESWAQEPTPKPAPKAHEIHWHKYINKEFGFSLRYPDSYRPITDPESCKGNDYRRWLLCLEQRDNPNTTIMVTIVIAVPFFVKTNRGGNEYTPQEIGQHLFYCGLGGSMGVGFYDECTFNLRDKTLEFSFSPPSGVHDETEQLELKMLRTLQIF